MMDVASASGVLPSLQRPRFTTTLKAFTGTDTLFDIDQEYLARKAVLLKKKRQRTVVEVVGHSELARKLVGAWETAPAKVRQAYEDYLKATAELIDGDISSEELQQSASIIFDMLASDFADVYTVHSANEKKKELLALFGHVSSDICFLKTAELAKKLCKWKAENPERFSEIEREGESSASVPEEQPEWGAEVSFRMPSDGTQEWKQLLEEDGLDGGWQTLYTDTVSNSDVAGLWTTGATRQGKEAANENGVIEKPEGGMTLRYFKQLCDQVVQLQGGGHLSGDELALALARVLDSERSGDEIAGELFDIIGDGGFELIQELLQNRMELTDLMHKALSVLKNEKMVSSAESRMPSYGTQVSVHTSSDKIMGKLRRKEEKRVARRLQHVNGTTDSEGLASIDTFSALIEACDREPTPGIDALIGKGNPGIINFAGTALPQGSARKVFKGYEEIRVPAIPTAALNPDEKLVNISDLDEFAQAAFEGYKTLNRTQSRVFHTAYHTNENILVCAPTGAGKTNIAMTAILHEIGQNIVYGVLQKNRFKIVYVAPMKALAAEVTSAFSKRLAPLGITVKELTGDMQLSKREIEETQMIVTTPEKWDVITRKSSDIAVAALVKLLIIDEVHLLNDDRGPVIETIVARTLRQVETTQNMIRIVGLSATLPNYLEVARFLRVNQDTGLFYFDASYRPVPLAQQYIGVSEPNIVNRNNLMNEICYNKILDAVKHGHQAMVFVHSRKDTVKTARILVEFAQRGGEIDLFINEDHPQYGIIKKDVSKSRNRELAELVQSGFGVHHAGMLRSDRNLTERLFSDGFLKVLVCTATLAWGVNLPAHMVVIKGTQLYDPKAGGFRELGMLDVLQIFGRAGRPQFDTSGEGIIITTHNQLARYLSLMTHQMPIESQFVSSLKDNLNAEVVLGTVSNVREATAWLGYTYLFVRMSSNPLVYGMTWEEVLMDTELTAKRKGLITEAARALDKAKMMRFDEKSGNMYFTDLGRVASHFYVQYRSVETYNEMLKQHMNESEVLHLVAHSSEFENIVVREEEQQELASLMHNLCPMEVRGGPEDKFGKINILIQIYISRAFIAGFSLVADSAYISASLGRIMRALFEICLQRGWCSMAALLLEYCKAVDRRLWPHQHPLRQFDAVLSPEILSKLENRGADMDRLYDMDEKEMGAIINHPHAGKMVMQCVQQFPRVELLTRISPITRTVLQVSLTISPDFTWKDRVHGATERWWIWVEDSENEHIYHSELFTLSKKIMLEGGHTISFTIPIFEPLPSQYYVRAISDSWLQAMTVHTVSFQHLILPELHPPHTELLDLRPLPVSAVGNKAFEGIYKFSHFNPIQTQAFHTLYHTSTNVLLGAPTGSGKTISAELAMMHLFNTQPDMKVIYIAPLKALVRERRENWQKGLMPALGKRMVELTGDLTPDLLALLAADVILCTPEKWDGISRNWQNRKYVTKVGLIVIDEIHLLGADRGPVLEVIVSRMRYISSQTDRPVRFIGLSTALANARDLADWLGIEETGLFNFKPSVRPVPLEVHIQGFPGKFYCPRMNSMNKPAYAAINTHSPLKPVLIFVSSRRQTRLTALDLIQYASADERPRQFLKLSEDEIMMIVDQVSDSNLKHTLQFGIGLHHAGLNERDRAFAEELFLNNKIQILVCTSTLAWGVNLPAHLVIIKGTEYYEGKEKRYIDYPITDVLQMMGRAGRPQFDQYGKAVILVHEPKKSFYKKFLYEPFPVESSLASHLHDHLNAEVASGTITSKSDAIDYLTWTYLFRRLLKNPSYYGVEDNTSAAINAHLSSLVTDALQDLEDSGCLRIDDDETIEPLMAGTIASQYYLNYTTVALFSANIRADISIEALLLTLSGAAEYDELPVRHNEDKLNEALAKEVRLPVDERILDDPHVKTNLLLQAHFSRLELPISDYVTDTKSVLDQSIRILQAMVDIAANGGWLKTALDTMHLLQMVMQGLWWDDSPLQMMPHMDSMILDALMGINITTMPELLKTTADRLRKTLQPVLQASAVSEVMQAWTVFPRIETRWAFEKNPGNGESSRDSLMDITLRRTNARGTNSRAYMPRFPKVKDEGWWLVLGNVNTWELHALKRTSFGNVLRTSFVIPDRLQVQGLTLLLVSDCYLGMDVQYEVTVENSPKL